MALTVHIVPTGDRLQATGQPPSTLEALHSWIAKVTDIKETDQIILTSKGRHVQQQTLLTEVCISLCWKRVWQLTNQLFRMNSTCMTASYSPRPPGANRSPQSLSRSHGHRRTSPPT